MTRRATTVFQKTDFESISTTTAEALAITMWHEMKGHNSDGGKDSAAFDAKYEAPVAAAITKARDTVKYPNNGCATCNNGTKAWPIVTELDEHMCECGIRKR